MKTTEKKKQLKEPLDIGEKLLAERLKKKDALRNLHKSMNENKS